MSIYNDKGINSSKDTAIINTYTLIIRAPKYIKQILKDLKGEIGKNRITMGFQYPTFSSEYISSRQNQ